MGYANSRYKDFYDIYVLLSNYEFDGNELYSAIKATFLHRRTGYDDIVAFEDGFTEDPIRDTRWNAFIKKKKAMIPVEFAKTVKYIKIFLEPVIKAIVEEHKFSDSWSSEEKHWN